MNKGENRLKLPEQGNDYETGQELTTIVHHRSIGTASNQKYGLVKTECSIPTLDQMSGLLIDDAIGKSVELYKSVLP